MTRSNIFMGMAVAAILATSGVAEAQDPSGKTADGGKENAGSIYTTSANPYIDRVARVKGDILLIVINERSTSNFTASTEATKDDSSQVSLDLVKGFLARLLGPLASAGSSTTAGDGSTTQSSRMATQMSVVVKEVLPNGTMIIEGTRTLVTNKETQTFVLSGIIRTADITPENTIDSSKIAEAEIRMEGKGLVSDRQRKGILTQVLDWLF
ncbi:MAG: flagellar basal body L-ring protein FlgH [Armatimonadetes bacterium]|nr:flagellar basal body L-ring protein FlgH [Armatimonadota bacterium]